MRVIDYLNTWFEGRRENVVIYDQTGKLSEEELKFPRSWIVGCACGYYDVAVVDTIIDAVCAWSRLPLGGILILSRNSEFLKIVKWYPLFETDEYQGVIKCQ